MEDLSLSVPNAHLSVRPAAKSVLVFIAGAVLYDLLLPAAHFLPATFLFLAGLLWFLGERNILKLFLTAACADAAVYVLFGVLLHVRLP